MKGPTVPDVTPAIPAPISPEELKAADVRLVVADMDGTLLTEEGEVPASMWPLLADLHERGIIFAPASGRQYATLRRLFERAADGMPFIAENGTYVVRDGVELGSITLERAVAVDVIEALRALSATGSDLGVVLCGKRSAYVERADDAFLAEARKYYAELAIVPDLAAVDDDVLKVAIYDFNDAETGTAPALSRFEAEQQVVISGQHWIDVMSQQANKGAAVQELQRDLGISHDQTAAFGDYLNDLEMIQAAGLSFAMANAHPDILAAARYLAPANTEEGVITTLRALIGD